MTGQTLRFLAMSLPILAFALAPSAAMAQGYTGSWPFVVTEQLGPFSGETTTYCITLTDNGSGGGRTHSGEATVAPSPLTGPKQFGGFQVIGQLIMVTIGVSGDTDGTSSWVFVAPTSNTSSIGTGVFNFVAGESYDSGLVTVGQKHGCAP